MSYVVSVEADAGTPLYVAISRAIAGDIARKRLRQGERLPGERSLAAMLGVNRNTVHAALQELIAQGWLEALPARGVFVRAPSQADRPRLSAKGVALRAELPARPAFALEPSAPAKPPGKGLQLTGGVPDPRLFPHELYARSYRRVLAQRGERLLDYGEPHGEPTLRRALADMLSRMRGLGAREHDVLITRGSQQAIWLAAHVLLRPGDRIGVEEYGYPPAWSAFRSAGAELVPLPVDGDGLRMDALERALQKSLRALYLTPHHQYPTMVALSAQRRLRLLQLAREHACAVLEDDYAHEFHYQGRPRLPLASVDHHGSVIYIGTLSKILMPGLRIGYAVAPRPVLDAMAALRFTVDRQGDLAAEAAVAELIEDGELERHTRRMRRVYETRRDALATALQSSLGSRVSFELPAGGMAFWVRVHGHDPRRWVERAEQQGVLFRAGNDYALSPAELPFVRMGFTRLDERELTRAVKLAARAL
ncbi:MAG TPA: PLP-dependent aminotransferase family protein [Polyangiales bacterium]|nr:PLP-dependent aminotransferase family protein [Polyangiales bacterium]